MNPWKSPATAVTVLAAVVMLSAYAASAQPSAAPEAPPAPDAPASPPPVPPLGGPLVPKAQAPAPTPFTLADRYLDAARRGDDVSLKLCLDKGVEPGVKDSFGRSALLLAAMDGHDLEMIKFLQSRGLAVDEPDNQGRTALGYAGGNGDAAIVGYLIEQGANVNRRDIQGQTPFFNAVLGGNKATVERMLAAGAQIDTADNFGDTALIGACAKGHEDIARLLIEKGADPALKDQEGRTAHQRAIEGNTYCRDQMPATK